jgi:hypothetical protein
MLRVFVWDYHVFSKLNYYLFGSKGTEQDIGALEISGNRLVNTCFEATVTNEKDGRDRKAYGYEAFFFEKYVNLSHFDDTLYRQMIAQSAKAFVEKRFNQSLMAFNLKKQQQEELESSLSELSLLGNEHDREGRRRGEGDFLERGHQSANFIRDRRHIGMRKKQSSRNVMGGELPREPMRSTRSPLGERREDGVKKSRISRDMLNSLRQELLEGDDNANGAPAGNDIANGSRRSRMGRRQGSNPRICLNEENDTADGSRRPMMGRRQGSNRRINLNEDLHGSLDSTNGPPAGNDIADGSRRSRMGRRQGSNRRISPNEDPHGSLDSINDPPSRPNLKEQQQQRERGVTRSSSRNSLMQNGQEPEQRERGVTRASSRNSLMQNGQEPERGIRRASSRNRLVLDYNSGDEDRRREFRRAGSSRSMGRHRLSSRNLTAGGDM